jgi:hypothetical protein
MPSPLKQDTHRSQQLLRTETPSSQRVENQLLRRRATAPTHYPTPDGYASDPSDFISNRSHYAYYRVDTSHRIPRRIYKG